MRADSTAWETPLFTRCDTCATSDMQAASTAHVETIRKSGRNHRQPPKFLKRTCTKRSSVKRSLMPKKVLSKPEIFQRAAKIMQPVPTPGPALEKVENEGIGKSMDQ